MADWEAVRGGGVDSAQVKVSGAGVADLAR